MRLRPNPTEARGGGTYGCKAGARMADMEFVAVHPTRDSISARTRHLGHRACRPRLLYAAQFQAASALWFAANKDPSLRRAMWLGTGGHLCRGQAGRGAFLDWAVRRCLDFAAEFPTVLRLLAREQELIPVTEMDPVIPAATLFSLVCIWTDINGRSFAAGFGPVASCTSTGAHGANRLRQTRCWKP